MQSVGRRGTLIPIPGQPSGPETAGGKVERTGANASHYAAPLRRFRTVRPPACRLLGGRPASSRAGVGRLICQWTRVLRQSSSQRGVSRHGTCKI